jgi:DNA polymerase
MPVPEPFLSPNDYNVYAFNVQFDQMAINVVGKHYGFKPIYLESCVDIMAIAARYGYPQSLEKLGEALNISQKKLSEGKDLVKLFCTPPFRNLKKDDAWHATKFRKFCEYCMRDNDAMREALSKMPASSLSAEEQAIWLEVARTNAKGVPIDHAAVVRINQVVKYYLEKRTKEIPKITGGAVQTIGQRDKILAWCADRGVKMKNLQSQTVEDKIKEFHVEPFDEEVFELLSLRKLIGGSAIKKYQRLEDMVFLKRIYDNIRYHGAGTGRITGGGFQLLNLPRLKVKPREGETYDEAVERVIKSFYDTTVLKEDDPLSSAKALVRPMIKAPEGKVIMAADWSSIEYILLMWFAGETEKVERFRQGFDPYIDFAMRLFGILYDQVTELQRQEAKPPVLGAGYMLGWEGLIEYAEGYGVVMTDEEAQFATNTYRAEHPLVVKSWYSLKNAAHSAVMNPGVEYRTHRTILKVVKDRAGTGWLRMTLPSGRALYYCKPRMTDSKYGPAIKHMGVDPVTKQWAWVYLKPMRIIENVIQALGRDILTAGLARLKANGYTRIGDIYDEAIMEEPVEGAKERLEQMIRLMCVPPTWAPDLPLFADGYTSKRYKKG